MGYWSDPDSGADKIKNQNYLEE